MDNFVFLPIHAIRLVVFNVVKIVNNFTIDAALIYVI